MTSPTLLLKSLSMAAAIAVIATGAAQADPDKVAYELQERCGKSSEKLFASFGASNSSDYFSGFENHYNPKFNSCFMLVTSETLNSDKTEIRSWGLWDVNENRLLAMFLCMADFDAINDQNAPSHACAIGQIASARGVGPTPKTGQDFARSMQLYMER